MADLLIKGMDLPTNCSRCRFWCICNLLNEYKDYESILRDERIGKDGIRHNGCPLVEVKGMTVNNSMDAQELAFGLYVNKMKIYLEKKDGLAD